MVDNCRGIIYNDDNKQWLFANIAETCRRENEVLRARLERNQQLMDGLAYSLHTKFKG